MEIVFYSKETGEAVATGDLFVLNGDEVWCDNYRYTESQEAEVGFEDFIKECPNIGWRVE